MAEANRGRLRSALRHRDFRLLAAGQAVSVTGDWLYNVALIVYVIQATHSAGWVAATGVIRFLPYVLLGTFAGVVADRHDRKAIMLGADAARGLVMTVITVGVAAEWHPAWIVGLAAASTTFSTVYLPAVNAATPSLVEEDDLAAANALVATIQNIAIALGPAVSGVLLLLGSPVVAFGVNAGTFFVSALFTVRIRTDLRPSASEEGEREASLRERVAGGFRAIASSSAVLLLVLLSIALTLTYGQELVLYALAATERLGIGEDGLAFMWTAIGVGGVLAAGLTAKAGAHPRQGAILALACAISATPLIALAFVRAPAVAYVLLALEGATVIVADVIAMTMLQRILSKEVLGRVFGILDSLLVLGIVAGSFLASAVVGLTDLRVALAAAGGLLVAFSLVLLPKARDLDNRAAERVRELAPRIELLGRLGIFEAVSRRALEALAGAITEKQVPAGTAVITEGEEPDSFYAVESGTLAVSALGESGAERDLGEMGPGEYFGEIGLLRGIPRTATVTARSDCRLYRVSGEDFLRIVNEGSGASGNLLAGATARLARTHPSLAEE